MGDVFVVVVLPYVRKLKPWVLVRKTTILARDKMKIAGPHKLNKY